MHNILHMQNKMHKIKHIFDIALLTGLLWIL